MIDVRDYFNKNYNNLRNVGLSFARNRGIWGDDALEIIHSAITKTYMKSQIVIKNNVSINEGWIKHVFFNKIRDELKGHFTFKKIFVSIDDWLIINSEVEAYKDEDISSNTKIESEVFSFIENYYTNEKIRQKYKFYCGIYFDKIINNKTWVKKKKEHPNINIDTVNSRVHDILKLYKFNKERGLV